MIELQRGFEEISESYRMAREILETFYPESVYKYKVYQRERIKIEYAIEGFSIEFDNSEENKPRNWVMCLFVSAQGSITHMPHCIHGQIDRLTLQFSQELGFDPRSIHYLHWQVFLKRDYDRAINYSQERS